MHAYAAPDLPTVVVFGHASSPGVARIEALLTSAQCSFHVRDLEKAPLREPELLELGALLERGVAALARRDHPDFRALSLDPSDDLAVARALARRPSLVAWPIVAAPARRRALVARPPELALRLLAAEMPDGESADSMVRRAVRGRPR